MGRRTATAVVIGAVALTLSSLLATVFRGVGTRDAASAERPLGTVQVATHGGSRPAAQRPIRVVVALGDSVPAGTACNCSPYVDLVADAVASTQHARVTAVNLSVPGQTIGGLTSQLRSSSAAGELARADVVLVTVGANDLEGEEQCTPDSPTTCYAGDLRALQPAYVRMLDLLGATVSPRAKIVVTGYWNVFLDGAVATEKGATYVSNSRELTQAVNDVIAAAAETHSATYVDIFAPFKGAGDADDTALLAADGDHPDAAGHRVIAESIVSVLTLDPSRLSARGEGTAARSL